MSEQSMLKTKVLITGSSGVIGRVLCPYLISKGYSVRGFDKCESDLPDFVHGDLEDLSSLRKAVTWADVVIHLAACADEADFITKLVPNNVIGVYNLFEAVRLEGVGKIIFASSVQTVNVSPDSGTCSVDKRYAKNHYGLLKLWAEDLAEMYSRLYQIDVIVARLGWYLRSQEELDLLNATTGAYKLYLSEHDMLKFFLCCLEASKIPFTRVYALSNNPDDPLFDMEPAQRLIGFEPQDIFPEGMPEW